jgi:DNA-binding NarL/FixJ family response regulator
MRTDDEIGGHSGHGGEMSPVRVFLIDDHVLVREVLAARLSLAPDLWVVGSTSGTDPDLIAKLAQLRPNVVTVEVAQLGAGLAGLLEAIAATVPEVRVVALTESQDRNRAVDAARAGAIGWVPKQATIDRLIEVLRGAAEDRAYYPPEHLAAVLRGLRADVRTARDRSGPLDVLSSREREVLISMVEGKRRAEIARELCVSANTVRTHTRNILTKLGVRSSLEAVSIARSAGLLPSDTENGGAVLVRTERFGARKW